MRPDPENLSLPRWLLMAGLGSLLFRGWLAVALPITGDEAYFYWWGVQPDWGYYDHPPMVGWLIAAMRATFGDTLWAIRLPVLLLPAAPALALSESAIRSSALGAAGRPSTVRLGSV